MVYECGVDWYVEGVVLEVDCVDEDWCIYVVVVFCVWCE